MHWRPTIGIALLIAASPAIAENWVEVIDDGEVIWGKVDSDSIRRGDDGLVYFRADGGSRADKAADCAREILYTITIYPTVTISLDQPNWRNEGRPIVPGSAGEAILRYACQHR